MKTPTSKELQDIVEKIAYQQTAEDQADDLFNKMGMLNTFITDLQSHQPKIVTDEAVETLAWQHKDMPLTVDLKSMKFRLYCEFLDGAKWMREQLSAQHQKPEEAGFDKDGNFCYNHSDPDKDGKCTKCGKVIEQPKEAEKCEPCNGLGGNSGHGIAYTKCVHCNGTGKKL